MGTRYDELSWARLTAIVAVVWILLFFALLITGQWLAALCWVVSAFFGFAMSTYTSRSRNEIL